MTPELYERWTLRQHPFDGLAVSPAGEDLVPLSTLCPALRYLVERLQSMYGDRMLSTAPDWHEHDGYVSEARPSTWEEVCSWLTSEDTLHLASQADTYVRTAIIPEGAEFYLRIYIPDESDHDYPEPRGTFDLTCSEEVARSLAAAVESCMGLRLTCEPAKQFFDRSYGG
jgi:hypothetical protein